MRRTFAKLSTAGLLALGVAALPLGCAVDAGTAEVSSESKTLQTTDGDFVVHVTRLGDNTVSTELFAKDGTPLARTRYVPGTVEDVLEWEMVAEGDKGAVRGQPDPEVKKHQLVDYVGFARLLYEDRVKGKLYDNRGCDSTFSSTGSVGACCDAHDDCYSAHSCRALSWGGLILGPLFLLLSACDRCNAEVISCATFTSPGPSTCQACGDCGQPWPWTHDGNTYSNGTATRRGKTLNCDGSACTTSTAADRTEIFSFVAGEIFSAKGATLSKVSGTGGTGTNMFGGYVTGTQTFTSNIVGMKYIGGKTLIAFADGRLLKINGTGGTGGNMFAITDSASGGFAGLSGYSYYAGYQWFSSAVNTITPVGSQMFVGLANGKLLKINGTGGTGGNMFAVTTDASGNIVNLSGYSYLAGSQNFAAAVKTVTLVDTAANTWMVGLGNGTLVKVNGGGTGGNMFAIQTDGAGNLVTVPGYSYFQGSQVFASAVTAVASISGQTLVGLANGHMVKVNGTGGSGSNMFALTALSCGLGGAAGYSYYVGSEVFDAGVTVIKQMANQTWIGLANGKMVSVTGTGGSGCNMLAIMEGSCEAYVTVSGYSYYVGAQRFTGGVVGVTQVGSQTFISMANGKAVKINGVGGTGCNMFAMTQSSCSGAVTGVPGYSYLLGSL